MIGLAVIMLFESALTVLRTYVFSHTTCRIDVELGARLFCHLLNLPLAYFQARPVPVLADAGPLDELAPGGRHPPKGGGRGRWGEHIPPRPTFRVIAQQQVDAETGSIDHRSQHETADGHRRPSRL